MTSQPEAGGLDPFEISIDRDAEVPMGVQLGWALCASIQQGKFRPGQRLPALRAMAEMTGLNVNTVRAVYQRLEQRGLVQSEQGSGTFVASTPSPRSDLARIASDAAREAHETGVDPRDVAAALYVAPAPSREPSNAAAQRRRALRQQIATLERALGEIEVVCPGVAPPPQATRRGSGPALLAVEDLERVRAQLVRRLAVVQDAVDGHLDESAGEHRAAGGRAVAGAKAAPTRKPSATKPDKPIKTKRAPHRRQTRRPAPAGA